MRVLGIDPSFRNTGLAFGFLDVETNRLEVMDLALLKTEVTKAKQVRRNSDDLRCAGELAAALFAACKGFQPDLVVAEVPSGTQSSRASWTLGITLGILATLRLSYNPLIEVAPQAVKRYFAGSKTANKRTMIDTAYTRYPHLPWLTQGSRLMNDNEHLADAVAILAYGLTTPEAQDVISVYRRAA